MVKQLCSCRHHEEGPWQAARECRTFRAATAKRNLSVVGWGPLCDAGQRADVLSRVGRVPAKAASARRAFRPGRSARPKASSSRPRRRLERRRRVEGRQRRRIRQTRRCRSAGRKHYSRPPWWQTKTGGARSEPAMSSHGEDARHRPGGRLESSETSSEQTTRCGGKNTSVA